VTVPAGRVHCIGNESVPIYTGDCKSFKIFLHVTGVYNTIQYNTKFVKRHVAVASEALANRSVRKQRRRRTNVL